MITISVVASINMGFRTSKLHLSVFLIIKPDMLEMFDFTKKLEYGAISCSRTYYFFKFLILHDDYDKTCLY